MLERGFEDDEANGAHKKEATHDEPEHRSTLLAFALLEGVAAMSGLAARTIKSLGIDVVVEPDQDFLRIEPDETSVRGHEATDEGLSGEIGELVLLERVKQAHADLGRRCDLLDRDPALFALESKELPKGFYGRYLSWATACSATFVPGYRFSISRYFLRARAYCLEL